MKEYFSTYVSGFEAFIEELLCQHLPDVEIIGFFGNMIAYKTGADSDQVANLKFFNSSHFLLRIYRKQESDNLDLTLKRLIDDKDLVEDVRDVIPKKESFSFRIRGMVKSKFVTLDNVLVASLETKIKDAVGMLYPDRKGADLEFIIYYRDSGDILCGIVFTGSRNYEKVLKRGEIHPELAHLLVMLSEPSEKDAFMDPFAGSGAVPATRLKLPYANIYASDIDNQKVAQMARRFCGTHIKLYVADALVLSDTDDESVDKIVTDPPWGHYRGLDDPERFYRGMFASFWRVLKPDGICVLLTAQKDIVTKLIEYEYVGCFDIERKFDVLVSGRKVGVYKLRKISGIYSFSVRRKR